MRKRKFRVFLWFLGMAGFIFLMITVVNSFRKDRGQNQIEEAFRLMDEGELSQAIEQLEAARETYRMVDQRFPKLDTLFRLHIRLKNWSEAESILHNMAGTMSDKEWLTRLSSLTEKTLPHDPGLAVSMAFKILSVDQQLNLLDYPPALDSVLGEAIEENLIRDGDYRGFRRKDDWSDGTREWWYYVADDDEEIEYQEFSRLIHRAFTDREQVVIDIFRPLPNVPEASYREMGFYGRTVYQGEALQDSTFLLPHQAITDTLDNNGSRLTEYANWFGWDIVDFLWNTTLMDPPKEKPYYTNVPYIMLRERVRQQSADRLVRLAESRGLLVEDYARDDCYGTQDINCWTIEPYWLDGMPDEFIALWQEKFPVISNRVKPAMTTWEAKKMALARDLLAY